MKALRRHPLVTRAMIKRVWASIREEYAKLSGNDDYINGLELAREIASAVIRLNIIHGCLHVLRAVHSEKMIGVLSKLGYKYNNESLPKFVENVARRAKMIEAEIDSKRKQLDALSRSSATGNSDFTSALVTLSRFVGYRVDPRRTLVTEFLSIKRQFEKESEDTSKKISKKR